MSVFNEWDEFPPINQIPLDDDEWQAAFGPPSGNGLFGGPAHDVDAEMMALLLELTDIVPMASDEFQAELETRLKEKLAEQKRNNTGEVGAWERELNEAAAVFINKLVTRLDGRRVRGGSHQSGNHTIMRRRMAWRALNGSRLVATLCLILVVGVSVVTAFPSVAESLSGYFTRDDSNVLIQRTEIPRSEASLYFSHELPSSPDSRRPLTDDEMASLANYMLRVPDMPGAPTTINTYDEENATLTQTYIIPKERSPHGNITIRFSQTPAAYYEPPSIGETAVVELVQIGELTGEYVQGHYEMRSAMWNGTLRQEAHYQINNSPDMPAPYYANQEPILIVDVESVWLDDPTYQRLVWREEDMFYTLEGSWQGGTLNLLDLAEQIIHDQPIFQRDVSGLPAGLPDEYELWFENISYFDDREAVVYEFRDDDWFVYITDAPARDIVFERPEVISIESEAVQVGDGQGEYAEGEWEITRLSLGSIIPFSLIQNEGYGETIPFQWVRWEAGDYVREVAVFNGCDEFSTELRPCYSRDELIELAAGLTFTPPDYEQRREAARNSLGNNPPSVRADMRATPATLVNNVEYATGYEIYSPRHIKFIPFGYNYSGIGYDLENDVVWQIFTPIVIENITFTPVNEITTYITPPVIMILQRQTTEPIEGLLSGCSTPEDATTEVIRLGNGGALYTTGAWGEGAEPFSVHDAFCLPGQTFQVLRWIEGPNTFEIMTIDAEADVDLDLLLSIAESMER